MDQVPIEAILQNSKLVHVLEVLSLTSLLPSCNMPPLDKAPLFHFLFDVFLLHVQNVDQLLGSVFLVSKVLPSVKQVFGFILEEVIAEN